MGIATKVKVITKEYQLVLVQVYLQIGDGGKLLIKYLLLYESLCVRIKWD